MQPQGLSAPTLQSSLNYLLLGVVYTTLHVRACGWRWRCPWWAYALLALIDVEANFCLVLAYRYTSMTRWVLLLHCYGKWGAFWARLRLPPAAGRRSTCNERVALSRASPARCPCRCILCPPCSVTLLDCFTIPMVLLLSTALLAAAYRRGHYAGAGICVAGLALLVATDRGSGGGDSGEGGEGGGSGYSGSSNPLLGDGLVLLGATLYAVCNVLQEWLLGE